MLVSYKWLSEYIDLKNITATELADKMSRTGIEVENVEVPEEGLKKIVVGAVKECIPHPDSDHLSICQVDIGEAELSQIVCGAPNIKAGQNVIVALPGSRITGNAKIKKSKMRGEVSNGMVCSLQELGYKDTLVLKEYANGIFVLPADAVPGTSVFPYLEMDDSIIELSITPNRADALSMRGVAYEVGAIYRQTPTFAEKKLVEDSSDHVENYLSIEVADEADAPTYRMRIIKDVKIEASPLWLQTRLMNAGIRPINNVVDVTNFTLLEFGQPMHAFDYDKIGSKKIAVRRGVTGEELITLDEGERHLTPENIVITNGTEPIGLAGVMGGLHSEITPETTTVALETALFDPLLIRKTSKMFNLRSESSSRYEKGINAATVAEAGDYAAAMIAELSGGTVVSGTLVPTERIPQEVKVSITLNRINDYLGTDLTAETVEEIFNALGFPYEQKDNQYNVTIPPRRWDISIEADIIEEVARIFGYDNLPSTLPNGEALPGSLTHEQQLLRETKRILEGNGLTEAISYALTTEEKAQEFTVEKRTTVKLQSPMSEDHAVLRQNLVSGLLDDDAYNVARKNLNVALYETGRVFYQEVEGELPVETNYLAIAMTGLQDVKDWQTEKSPVDFYLLKGIVENLMSVYGATQLVRFEATADWSDLHPGRAAKVFIGETLVGFIGQVHPLTAKKYEINETYVCELNLDLIFASQRSGIDYENVSKYPAVKRDIALLVDQTVSNQQLVEVIRGKGGKFLKDIQLFDIFQGEKLGENKKSMAYSLTFLNSEATLVDEEVTKVLEKIEKELVELYQVVIR